MSGAVVIVYPDISSHNGTPNLRALWAAGYRYLMLKATEGTGYAWPAMQSLAAEWHSFGPDARVGYYHWFYASLSASAQHDWFWRQVAPVFRAGDWLMTDFEDVAAERQRSDAETAAGLREFNRLCSAHARIDTYTGNWFLDHRPLCVEYLRTQTIVLSDYAVTPPRNPHGFRVIVQQFTDAANLPGFAAGVDCNRVLDPVAFAATGPTNGDSMTATDVQQINDHTDAAVQHEINDDLGTKSRIVEIDADVNNLPAYILACVLALSGQAATLPGGAKVTNLTTVATNLTATLAAHTAVLAEIRDSLVRLVAQPVDGGSTLAEALDGATLTLHTNPGGS